ncbi:helix-turn-helix domain-containing protein [Streptomyces sp. NPDC007355]|uniref:helix-turn-helix domain-containing protein n=1 Tax=Streptomyces sp. NPDC007355 TaxID=3364778 RepID=UPI0036A58D8F
MLTLGSLSMHHPDLGLKFVWPVNSTAHHGNRVGGLIILSFDEFLQNGIPGRLGKGALVLLTGVMFFRIRGRIAVAIEELLRQLSLNGCVGLIITATSTTTQPFSHALRDMSERLALPLLVSTAPTDRWADVHTSIQQARLASAERRAAQLSSLMQQLPAQLADAKAMQRIASWLAGALDAQVLVSEPDRVLAASPSTAAEQLAQAIIRQSVEGGAAESSTAPHTQLISLAPASGADTVLAVARHTPFDETELRLLRHAAKLLGLIDQARLEYRVVADAHRVRTVAVELLLDGEVDKARRVMEPMTPGLFDTDTARFFVAKTQPVHQEAAVRLCEAATVGRTLVIADPRQRDRVLILQPVRPDEPDDTVPAELVRLVTADGPVSALGGSGVYSITLLADALNEACVAQQFALHQPDSVALSAQHTELISLLCQHDAQRWARQLLSPLMTPDVQWEQMRETLPVALAHPYTVAARRLHVHRNTVTRRVARAADLLGMDFALVGDRIAIGLALELVTHRESPETSRRSVRVPTLQELLAVPQIQAWAETLLSTVHGDRRDLLGTAKAWLSCNAHLEPTARALGLSEVTVRTHIRALEVHMSRDLSSLNGMRDLQFALHIVTGEPRVLDSCQELYAAA